MIGSGEIDEEADQEDFVSQDDAYGQKEPNNKRYSSPNKTRSNTKSSSGTLSPRTNELYSSSIKRVNHFQQNKQPTQQMARANKSSRQLANNRQSRLIDNVVGNSKTLKRARLILILKKFNINYADDVEDENECPRPVFCKICDICRIQNQNQNEEEEEEEEELYDAEKLKELLKKAAGGGKATGVAAQMKPSVVSAISNMPIDIFTLRSRSANDGNSGHGSTPTTPTKSQKKKKKNSPKLTINISPNRNTPNSPTNSNQTQSKKKTNDNDDEGNFDDDLRNGQQKPNQKKRVTGAKYLPSFYDNLDMNRSPM